MESEEDRLLEMVMLRLRLRDGLNLKTVQNEFGEETASDVSMCLEKYARKGLVEFQSDGLARLADPHGLLVSNDIIAEIFSLLTDGD